MSTVASDPPTEVAASPPTDSLAVSVFILLALTVVQRLVGLVRSVLFCRWLEPDQLGQWDLAFGFLMLAAPLAMLGIPGSFGRYLEHYRQRGQMRAFLRRATVVCAATSVAGVAAIFVWPNAFSQLILGARDQYQFVYVVGLTLVSVLAFNFLVTLFTSMRRYRIVSAMQFLNTVLFALVSVVLLMWFPPQGVLVVAAFGTACLATAVFALFRLIPILKSVPTDAAPLPQVTLWKKLLPFAFWWWMMNSITNVFDIIDRFMIVHFAGLSEALSLDMVGQLHSARVLPMLFIGVADMLAGLVTPYLSSDWEAGRRRQVSLRLNTIIKLFTLMLVIGAATLMLLAPWLFGTLFKHKFSGGLEILPYCLAACIWLSMQAVMNNYLWCAEKSHYLSLTLAAGLVLNVVLNLALLPVWGLMGVAVASAASKAVSFGLLWWVATQFDWKSEPGMLLVALLPALLPLGPMVTLLVTVVGICGVLPSLPFLRDDERELMNTELTENWRKIKQKWYSPKASTSP